MVCPLGSCFPFRLFSKQQPERCCQKLKLDRVTSQPKILQWLPSTEQKPKSLQRPLRPHVTQLPTASASYHSPAPSLCPSLAGLLPVNQTPSTPWPFPCCALGLDCFLPDSCLPPPPTSIWCLLQCHRLRDASSITLSTSPHPPNTKHLLFSATFPPVEPIAN